MMKQSIIPRGDPESVLKQAEKVVEERNLQGCCIYGSCPECRTGDFSAIEDLIRKLESELYFKK